MACIFYIKKDDILPALRTTLTDSSTGLPVDLTTATSATVRIVKAGATTATVNAAATIVSPATSGKLEYAWNAGDTDEVGDYYIEWTVNFGVGYPKTYPSSTYNLMTIVPRLPS